MVDLIHNFGARKRKRGSSFDRVTDVTPEVMGEAEQHSPDGGLEEQAIVVMDSIKMGFHGQPAMETAPSDDLEEAPLTHEESQGGVPSEQIASRPAMTCLPGPCIVSCCFLTDCCYILIFLHRVRFPLWRKFQPRPPIWSNYSQHCLGC